MLLLLQARHEEEGMRGELQRKMGRFHTENNRGDVEPLGRAEQGNSKVR
jgi:hypothetical protein